MNKQSVKRRREDDGSEINRLSQLPQPILHNILSLLSQKDAVQTSVLSKSWRYLWHGRLNVEFHEKYCFNGIKEFWHFFDKTLQRYLDQNLSLQKFLVEIQFVVDLVLLQKWIPMVIMNMGVKSLHLIFIRSCTIVFPLPLIFSQSESLVELHLKGLNLSTLKSTDNVMLNNLQTLRLHNLDITDEIFEKIISGCPLIENLDLLECTGLNSIKLHKHHKIKSFGCSMDEQTIIEIEDPHPLESVSIQNCRNWFLHHKNMHFPHLKSLKLRSVQLPAETFDNFSSFFPCLNELMLDSCHGLKEFLLFSSSIKRLTMKIDQRNRIKASIDTPNILYFEYTGYGFLPSIKFTPTSNEWASHISVWCKLKRSDKDATSWFLKLNKLLEALSQSHITLEVGGSNSKKLHIKDSYARFYKPVVVKHLKLSGCFLSSSDPTNLNWFLRICRPRYIHMDRYNDWQTKCNLVEYISKLIPDEKGCYFWLQDLEEVTFEVWDTKAGEWNCVQLTSLQALCCNIQHQIRFRLTWKEQ